MSASNNQVERIKSLQPQTATEYLEAKVARLEEENRRLSEIITMYAELAAAAAQLTNEVFNVEDTEPATEQSGDSSGPADVGEAADQAA